MTSTSFRYTSFLLTGLLPTATQTWCTSDGSLIDRGLKSCVDLYSLIKGKKLPVEISWVDVRTLAFLLDVAQLSCPPSLLLFLDSVHFLDNIGAALAGRTLVRRAAARCNQSPGTCCWWDCHVETEFIGTFF
ncbi:hypothetical protein MRX96_030036 [Rhipicephalus microplus]